MFCLNYRRIFSGENASRTSKNFQKCLEMSLRDAQHSTTPTEYLLQQDPDNEVYTVNVQTGVGTVPFKLFQNVHFCFLLELYLGESVGALLFHRAHSLARVTQYTTALTLLLSVVLKFKSVTHCLQLYPIGSRGCA